MISFLLAALVAVLIALAFVLVPLLGTDRGVRDLRRRRRALDALSEDLDPADYQQRRERLDAALAESTRSSASPALLIGLVLAVPLATGLLYQAIGESDGIVRGDTQAEQIRDGLTRIARQLERHPDDSDNWIRLGMAYKELREYSSAEHAFRRALYIHDEDAFVQVELAETLLFASAGSRLPEASRELLSLAVANDPENQKALWLLGIGAFQDGEYDQALTWWRQLDELLPPGTVRESVRDQIARAQSRLSGTPVSERALPPGHPPIDEADNGTQPVFRVELSLDPDLAQQLQGTEVVFLIARSAEGPAAPLAVRRLTGADLPISLSLSDRDAMVEGLSLSSFPDITLTARVSFSGSVEPRPGDFEGHAGPISILDAPYAEVVIDRIRGQD